MIHTYSNLIHAFFFLHGQVLNPKKKGKKKKYVNSGTVSLTAKPSHACFGGGQQLRCEDLGLEATGSSPADVKNRIMATSCWERRSFARRLTVEVPLSKAPSQLKWCSPVSL